MTKFLFVFTGIVSIVMLTYALFFRNIPKLPESVREEMPHVEELEYFLNDRMDYSLEFSRILVEKRIEKAEKVAAEVPELKMQAQAVIDSLRNRLARRARIGY